MAKNPKLSFKPTNEFPTTKIKNNRKISFSFEYLDLKNNKYSFDNLDNRQIVQFNNDFNKKIKEYCEKDNFKQAMSSEIRWKNNNHIHPIDWKDNQIKESGFPTIPSNLKEQVSGDCWQLGINSTTYRIHGFFIGDIFYIVWLDPSHNLYHSK